MIKTILVDDERWALSEAKEVLASDKDILIVAEAEDLNTAEKEILYHKPDLVILDIQFDEEKDNSINLIKKLEKRDELSFYIIFLTAHYKEYLEEVVKKVGITFPYKYLSKPPDLEEITPLLKHIKNSIAKRKNSEILLTSFGNTIRLVFDKILYISTDEESKNYINIFFTNGNKEVLQSSLIGIWEKLPKDRFFKVSGSTIINKDFFLKIRTKNGKWYCVLEVEKRQVEIPVSRKNIKNFGTGFI